MYWWIAGAVISTAALICVTHFFYSFFSNPVRFSNRWSSGHSGCRSFQGVYDLTVLIALSYYIYAALSHAFAWMTDDGEWMAMAATSVLGFAFMQSMGEMAVWIRATEKRRLELLEMVETFQKNRTVL